MRKVCLFISSMHKAGAERVMLLIAKELVRRGKEVTLVTQWDDRGKPDAFAVPDTIRRRFSELTEKELTGSRIVNFIRRYRKLRKIWKEEKPDLILSFIGKNNVMAVQTGARLHIPVVAAVRGDPSLEYTDTRLKKAAFGVYPKAAGIVLQTQDGRLFFPERIRKKSVILPNPIDPSFCLPPYEGAREKTIIAVGRIDENKNQRMLMDAFAALSERFPEHRLLLVGTGPAEKELAAYAKTLPCGDRISFPGNLDDIASAIRPASLFVLTSDTEGMPNALLEAMALGIPVISTDCPCGGPRQLIRDGENGLLVPVRDTNALAAAMERILSDPAAAEKMGTAARSVQETYAPDKALAAWAEYLESVWETWESRERRVS
ncbi:MAG: glycosyltransferase family 4 protein [Lachnospiraceae bacterium]|nr:glycosyltransferase family 4 protein [Lachnospiraceae bacterium]